MRQRAIRLAAFLREIIKSVIEIKQRAKRRGPRPEHRSGWKVKRALGRDHDVHTLRDRPAEVEIDCPIHELPDRREVARRPDPEIWAVLKRLENPYYGLARSNETLEQEVTPGLQAIRMH